MKNFIIRVYRQDEEDQNQIVGIVEHVEEDRKSKFESIDQLMHILCSRHPIGHQIDEAEVRKAISGHTSNGEPEWGDIRFETGFRPGKGEMGEREN